VRRWEFSASNVRRNQPFHEFPGSIDGPIKTIDAYLACPTDRDAAQNEIPDISPPSHSENFG